jgi:predicted DNA-binding WGR domain protein
MIYFKNTTGNHNKWWSIAPIYRRARNDEVERVVGHVTCWGRIGTRGSRREKDDHTFHPNHIKRQIIDKIESKLNKGYVHIDDMSIYETAIDDDVLLAMVQRGWCQNSKRIRNRIASFKEIDTYFQPSPTPSKPLEEIIEENELNRFVDLLE